MRRKRLVACIVACALGVTGIIGGIAISSEPAKQSINVPGTAGEKKTITWTGSIPPGSNPTSSCTTGVNEDHHEVNIGVANYESLNASFTFSIKWDQVNANSSDEILTVLAPDGSELGSSDGGAPAETVIDQNLAAGKYDVIACGFVNAAPQEYTGKLVVETSGLNSEKSLPAAPAQGLKFGAATTADLQRDEAEPLIEVDGAGRTFTCGPTGFSQAADYAQVSTDGGDQFHMIGAPPRGQQGTGGGGDCAMATSPDPVGEVNDQKVYRYSYSGLGGLTGFTTAVSDDGGHTLSSSPDNGSIPGVDRQWQVALDNDTVLLGYNRQAPRSVEILKSTNGGLTYGAPGGGAMVTPTSVLFPGPLMALPAKFNPDGADKGRPAYFTWTSTLDEGFAINLGVSTDLGETWKNCVVAKSAGDPATSFAQAQHDNQGNIYVVWTEQAKYHTYLSSLKQKELSKCKGAQGEQPTVNPGFSTPVQVDRGNVRTTVFSWVAAGGKPGRVTVTFAGTQSDGNPNTGAFKASWFVYANQSLNALSKDATFSQVKATTHPMHYGSICLNGLGCDLDVPKGDRSMADFFAVDYNPITKATQIVYNRPNKLPSQDVGHVATPMVVSQIAGPSNGGGTLSTTGRKPLRTSSTDPKEDALSSYSNFGATPATQNEPAGDFLSAKIGAPINLENGKPSKDGGFTVTMKVADLSDEALQSTMGTTLGKSLLWIFRFTNGHQDGGASARYNPAEGFTFGFNDYTTAPPGECGPSDSEKCVVYRGGETIQGKVQQGKGIIKLTVPLSLLKRLKGSVGDGQTPKSVKAIPGSRLYDAAAFSTANVASPVQQVQSLMYPLDNTPAFDFKIPGGVASTLRSPLVKSQIADKTPARGARNRMTARLAACIRFPGDRSKLRGTMVKFQKLKGQTWKTFAKKKVNKKCKAGVFFRSNFKKARFRAVWPQQVKGYHAGRSKVRRVRTH
ncbi:MAG: hypothetical protein QOH26_599 [Actinomycetota bacterium]|nr:hypothetical protein [Actinomycetota bacterium]